MLFSISWANYISLIRLFLAPVIFALLVFQNDYHLAFYLFIFAGLTDAVDGYVARHFNNKSKLGSYLDPIADKFLLSFVYIALVMIKMIPLWFFLIILARDIAIVMGATHLYFVYKISNIKPLFISKINTVLQILLATTILLSLMLQNNYLLLNNTLILAVTFTTIASWISYLGSWINRISTH